MKHMILICIKFLQIHVSENWFSIDEKDVIVIDRVEVLEVLDMKPRSFTI